MLEGRDNIPRRPLDEHLVAGAASGLFAFRPPMFLSLYTKHPHKLINAAHVAARTAFRLVRAVTTASWTGNVIVMVGDKAVEVSR